MQPGLGKALLFDIDGTLADTDALHLQAFNQVFGPRGHVFDHTRFTKELQGYSSASIGERFLTDEPPKHERPSWKRRKPPSASSFRGKSSRCRD
jgi:beta-phosphoglucomutase-like phosphatase (HAD superfamily)